MSSVCEYCGKEHDGSFGSGGFCNKACCAGFSTYAKRDEISRKVSLLRGGNGKPKPKKRDTCLHCGKINHSGVNYCSISCSQQHIGSNVIKTWLLTGTVQNERGTIPKAVRRFLLEEAENRCSRCWWKEINPVTKRVPLEVEHIDGDHMNNKRENLAVLCPNCHSITPTYKALNMGHGRKHRRDRYAKEKLL